MAVCLIGIAGCKTMHGTKGPVPFSRDSEDVVGVLRRASEASRIWEMEAKKPTLSRRKEFNKRWRPIERELSDAELEEFPLKKHVIRYQSYRPWAWNYLGRLEDGIFYVFTNPPEYKANFQPLIPRSFVEDNAETLRVLLKNNSPDIRALAAEALAVLHNPEDIPFIAELIDDHADAPPFLGLNITPLSPRYAPILSPAERFVLLTNHDLVPDRSWRKQKVSDYAKRSLELMTGTRFKTQFEFMRWWANNSGGKDCLWYWQLRVKRERWALDRYNTTSIPWPGETAAQTKEREQAAKQAMFEYNRQKMARELNQRSPELEAKVFLLLPRLRDFAPSEDPFWPHAPTLRLSSERLLELLERKNLWIDVDWDEQTYSRMVERMGLWADTLFTPDDVPRLKAILEKERKNLWEPAAQTLEDGIQRLLDAKEEKLLGP